MDTNDVNNVVGFWFPLENLAILCFYLRCNNPIANDETLGGLRAICENLLIKDSSVRILAVGDANREHVACKKTLGKFL